MKATNAKYILGALAALCLTEAATAQEATGNTMVDALGDRFYVAPMASFTFADSDRDSKDGFGGALIVGKSLLPAFNLEAAAFYTRYKGEVSGSSSLKAFGVNALVFPSTTLPGLFGLGGIHYGLGKSSIPRTAPAQGEKPKPNQALDSVVFDIGLGYLIGPIGFLNDGGVRLEARGRIDEKSQGGVNDFIEPVVSAGLLIPIGAVSAPPPPPVAPEPVVVVPVPVDTDGDGVFDEQDQCPDTPKGTAVDATGCPLPALVKLVCNDPAARNGKVLSLAGCGQGDKIVLSGVNFDFDKATLTANATTILNDVADEMSKWQQVLIELGGHTDSRGSDDYNQTLSEARVKSVQVYLGSKGITEDRISAKGFGEASPMASNDTDEGRALNRRVELTILGAGDGTAAAPVAPAEAAPAEEPAPAAADAAPAETVSPAGEPVPETPATEAEDPSVTGTSPDTTK